MQKPHKYGAQRTEVYGISFASKKEAGRYKELALLEKAGAITDLTIHPRWVFMVEGHRVGAYTADFSYGEDGQAVVEDVKSKATKTEAYGLRKRLMKALYGIEIRET